MAIISNIDDILRVSSDGTINIVGGVLQIDGTTVINNSRFFTGDGSGLTNISADTLDGQDGTYYLDWTNVTNKPSPTITLAGDLTGSVTLTSLGNGTLTATIAANSVALGTDTTGNYVATVTGTANEIEVTGSGSESAAVTIGLPNDVLISNNLTVNGNLTINGTTTTINAETINLADNIITLNSNYTGSTPTENAGIEVERGTLTNVVLQWNETSDHWEIASGGTVGRILTTGDEGTGNGLDADTVDGLQASQFLRSDADDTFTGNLQTNLGTNGIRFGNSNQTDTNDGFIAAGRFASGLNIVGTQTIAGTGRQIRLWGSVITEGGQVFWHSGNDGAASGLDADLLDGQQGSFYQPASTAITTSNIGSQSVAFATSAGSANTLTTARTISLSGDVTGSVSFNGSANVTITAAVVDDSHNHVIANVDGLQAALDAKLNSATYTAADVLTKLLTVDGATSSLDADLLDGQHGTYYLDWTNVTNKPSPTLTLTGDATGSATFTNLGNATLTVTVANDSHTHDTRYYTEAESDNRFFNVAGDTVTGTAVFLGNMFWQVSAADAAYQRVDARDDATNFARMHWYGINDTGGTSNFRHAWYDGANYINVTANSGGRLDFTGSAASMYIGSDRVYDDGYHPDADNSDALNGISAVNLYNNMNEIHSARTSFDATVPSYDFGYRFVQGNTNGPGTGGSQFYSWYIGLGNQYPATGSGSYGAMFAVDRNSATPYLSVRYNEANNFSTWRRISAGKADTLTTARTIGGVSFDGSANINLPGVNTAGNQNTSGNAATTSQRNFSGDISTTGQGRFTGWYNGNAATGLGAEIGISDGQGYIFTYNRQTSSYGILNISTGSANMQFNGSAINVTTGSLQQGGNQVWHAGNDGAGSGLDADLLDGQQGSYYQKKTNVQDAAPSGATGDLWYESDTGIMHVYYDGFWVDVAPQPGSNSNLQLNSLGVGTAASGTTGEIRATNDVTAYFSDARLKTFEGVIPNALDKVNSLNGYYFRENDTAREIGYNNPNRQVGVSAQEVEAVLPEVVTTAPISDEYLTVKYEKMVPLLIEAIKELDSKYQARINELENEIRKLKGE
jgi:hypothetical protein